MTAKTRAANEQAETKDELEAIAENAGRYARKMLDETHHLGDNADAFIGAIRQEPVKSTLIALGVGAVLGMLLRRS